MTYLLQFPEVAIIPLQPINMTSSTQHTKEQKTRIEIEACQNVRATLRKSKNIDIHRAIDAELKTGLGTSEERMLWVEFILKCLTDKPKLGPEYQVI